MGASLLAKASFQSTLTLNVPASSRAGSLPQFQSGQAFGLSICSSIHFTKSRTFGTSAACSG
ncbi:hypothetical protein C1895_13185 [Pseudomonas sp. FW305-3-2-15-E-TSA4]|nr:hypothetical protein C1895_13185 [Pseudomonas sp. FW305-3-2-15-E-TSA4]